MWSTLVWTSCARRGSSGRRGSSALRSQVVPTPAGWTPSLASVWSARRQQREHADRAGDRRRVGDDLVGGGRDPVAAGGGDVAHRHDHRLAGSARQLELAPDELGAEDAAAGRIDAQDHRLDVLVVARLADQVGGRQAADGSGRRHAVDDLALGDDDADRVAGDALLDVRQVVVERDLAEGLARSRPWRRARSSARAARRASSGRRPAFRRAPAWRHRRRPRRAVAAPRRWRA